MAIREATPIVLTAAERATLAGWVRSRKTEQRLAERARLVLLAAAGVPSRAIAREFGCARGMVSKWRLRFAQDRLAGFADAPRSGKPGPTARPAIAAFSRCSTGRRPRGSRAGPHRCSQTNSATSAISTSGVFLRARRIDLAGRKS
jgi:Helix-turn-helix domain